MRIVKAIASLVMIGVIICSGAYLEKKLNGYRTAKISTMQISQEMRSGREIDFEKLKKRNPDVKGWIYLPDSEIDYPIVQAKDDDFYMHRDIDKNYLYDGSIFIEAANEEPFKDFNTVIYGHHMFSGAMFCGLDKYGNEDYWKDHRIIQIETPERSYDLLVVAYCNEPSDSELYSIYFEDQDENETWETAYDDGSETVMTKEDFTELIKDKAVVLSGDGFDEKDTFVTLSTCAYNYDEARTQVIGILKEPATETNRQLIVQDRYEGMNIWLALQILVGVIMASVVIGAIVGVIRER